MKNMSQAFTFPVFGSSGRQSVVQGQLANQNETLQMDSGSADPMDFDLLAEYLLDDASGTANGISFDFQ